MTTEADTSVLNAPEPGRKKLPAWLRIALVGRQPRFTLVRIAVVAAVAFIVFGFILLPIRIDGPSMLPTYREGRFNLVNRLAYLRHEPHRGDVVTIRVSGREYSGAEFLHDLIRVRVQLRRLFRPRIMYMKRIVGLPGETVAFSGGRLLVDGQPLDEPYCVFPCDWERPPQRLGADQYFLVGDNRAMRMEDHTFGVPERARIVGKVIL